jgi:hypothetical protein
LRIVNDYGGEVASELTYRVGLLNRRSVRNWVGEGHAQLNNVYTCQSIIQKPSRVPLRTSATSFHPQHDIGRFLGGREPRCHICDERRLHFVSTQFVLLRKNSLTLPSFLHCAKVFLIASIVAIQVGIGMAKGQLWFEWKECLDEEHSLKESCG